MAQYEIAHQCGHSATVNITGTNVHGEREAKAERLARKPCPACSRQQEHDQRARDAEEAAARNASAGLPPLEGSARQVAWAEQLRADAIAAVTGSITRAGHDDLVPAVTAVITRAAARETSADAWIDARSDPRSVIKARMDGHDRHQMDEYGKLARLAGGNRR